MKSFLMPTITAAFMFAGAAAAEPLVYQVSKAGADKDRLNVIYGACVAAEKKNAGEADQPCDYLVSRKIDGSSYLVYRKRFIQRVIGDSMTSIGGGGGSTVISKTVVDYDTPLLLRLSKPADHAVGETIKDIIASKTEKTIDIDGSAVRELVQDTGVAAMSREQFVALLKGGRMWTLPGFEKKPCFQCGGDGKLGAMEKFAKCPDCKGKGSAAADLLVKW